MLEEYHAVTSPTVKNRPFPAAPAPPGDGEAPPFAVIAAGRERARARIWGGGGGGEGGGGGGNGSLGWVAGELVLGLGSERRRVSLCLWEEAALSVDGGRTDGRGEILLLLLFFPFLFCRVFCGGWFCFIYRLVGVARL